MKKTIISALAGLLLATSCVNLDIPPRNLTTPGDLLSNEAGMDIYMARMYSNMPFEDFKYMGEWGIEFNSWLGAMGIEGTGDAVNRDGVCRAFTGERTAYWEKAFRLLRDANFLIENLPQYGGGFATPTYNHYLGEAHFVRATVFSAMARRFGGVPLVTRVIPYPAESDVLEVPRSTEEQTWDQVLSDYDMAATLLMDKSIKSGYSNKFVALAFKAEAMLYAGSVAKYNETVTGRLTGYGQKTGVRVMGFAPETALTASKKYFTEAYKAARQVMTDGGYSLYKKKWSGTDRNAQYQNMVDMFSDLTSPENIYVKEYVYPTMTHGYDAYSAPFIFKAPLSSGTCVTADLLELYEGFPRYSDGSIKVTDGNTNTQGNYLFYDSTMDFFKNAEPRLRAYVIFPGDVFKGKEIEIRAGVYTGSTPIRPLFNDYSYSTATEMYQKLDAYTKKPKTLYLSSREGQSQEIVDLGGGKTMAAAGANGPFYNLPESCMTGLFGRKWLNPDPAFQADEGKSAQPYILMRYAQVLLTAAEAGVELALAGEPSPDGSDMLQVATDAVNAIRERAGASQLTTTLAANIDARNIVRREQRKEFALEHKVKWDLRRWRVNHYEGRDGFWGETRKKESFSDNSLFRFRGLYPFYSTQAGKYFFDVHFQWIGLKSFEYNIIDYYFAIPGNEVTKSPVIDQQPNR